MITHEDYKALLDIFEKYKTPVDYDEFDESKDVNLIQEKNGDFILFVTDKHILVSYHISCLPNYSSFILYILLKNFKKKSKIYIHDNYMWSTEKNCMVFGEEALALYEKKQSEIQQTVIKNDEILDDLLYRSSTKNLKEC